ncbi:MAG: histidine phosphatase family protein, partial [Sphingomonadaceae bacterium]|nr:histidine phosphatase family protein [Sphingomonadaceae bacterium]
MKILGLFRHAKSDWNDARLRDFDRPLNERGRKGASIIGKHIHTYGIKWDKVIASPA